MSKEDKVKLILFFGIFVTLIVYILMTNIIGNRKAITEKEKSEKIVINSKPDIVYTGKTSSWLWKSAQSFSAKDMNNVLDFAKSMNIQTIYLRIDDYIDIYEMKDQTKKNIKLKDFNEANKKFIKQANKRNIKIHALGGDVTWAEPDYRYMTFLLLDYVKKFNTNEKDGFSGIQFDIESYNMNKYESRRTNILKNYLTTVDKIVKTCKIEGLCDDVKFSLGFTVPFWFDNENNNHVTLRWNKQTKPVVYHLLDILNRNTNSYVVIMSYRNFAEGKDGSIEHAFSEIEYADKYAPNVSIIIGQETTYAKLKKISFFGKDKKLFNQEINKIRYSFNENKTFDGIAIHNLLSYMQL